MATTATTLNYNDPSEQEKAVNVPSGFPEKTDEKTSTPNEKEKELDSDDKSLDFDTGVGDPLPPIEGLPEETTQFTFRAVFVGCVLGCVVQASNMYLGLKTGFTFGSALFGSILGFVILKLVQRFPEKFFGGYFGPKENCTVQSAAVGAGGLGIIFVNGVPAMYQLGLLGEKPADDIGRLFAFTFVSAFYGLFFAIPLRKFYILRQKLVFPSPTAAGFTIYSFHSSPAGLSDGRKKGIALGIAFIASVILRVVSTYAPGILWDWHWAYWFYLWGWKGIIQADNWGWFWEWTPAFLGAGVLSGVNASVSFWFGSVLAWGIIGPALLTTHRATGIPLYEDKPEFISYYAMSFDDPTSNEVSPRYWVLWPGVMIMIVASFAEVGCNYKPLVGGVKSAYYAIANAYADMRKQPHKYHDEGEDFDPTTKDERIPAWVWGPGIIIMIICTCAVLAKQFGINVGLSILAIILGFLFSLIGVQSAGDTDINPVSTCAKASQLVFGGITRSYDWQVNPASGMNDHAMRVNLISGIVAACSASQTVDLTGDLKTGHLLRAKPRNQAAAQFIGAICAIFLSVGLFVLFTSAYPCVLDPNALRCSFAAPSVAAWSAVTQAVTAENGLPLPASAGYTSIAFGVFTLLVVMAKYFLIPQKYWHWIPNMNAIGLAFTLNQTTYPSAMAVGSIVAWAIKKRSPRTYSMYAFTVAAGLMAGEGIGGVINAILQIANVPGSTYGTAAGCPNEEYCG